MIILIISLIWVGGFGLYYFCENKHLKGIGKEQTRIILEKSKSLEHFVNEKERYQNECRSLREETAILAMALREAEQSFKNLEESTDMHKILEYILVHTAAFEETFFQNTEDFTKDGVYEQVVRYNVYKKMYNNFSPKFPEHDIDLNKYIKGEEKDAE